MAKEHSDQNHTDSIHFSLQELTRLEETRRAEEAHRAAQEACQRAEQEAARVAAVEAQKREEARLVRLAAEDEERRRKDEEAVRQARAQGVIEAALAEARERREQLLRLEAIVPPPAQPSRRTLVALVVASVALVVAVAECGSTMANYSAAKEELNAARQEAAEAKSAAAAAKRRYDASLAAQVAAEDRFQALATVCRSDPTPAAKRVPVSYGAPKKPGPAKKCDKGSYDPLDGTLCP